MNTSEYSLSLPISIGEGLDKLSILDIKLKKIKDEDKRKDVKKEYDMLFPLLKKYIDMDKYLYDCLVYINTEIWDVQDVIRAQVKDDGNVGLHKVLDLNDMRFRIKKRMNLKVVSGLHEQKGFSKKVGLFLSHLGLGDMINMIGAIRYSALDVDYLYVVCKNKYSKTIAEALSDDPFIQVIPCYDDDRDVPNILFADMIDGQKITKRYVSGMWARAPNWNIGIPHTFYDTLGYPRHIRKEFFHITVNAILPVPDVEYVFTHSTTSLTANNSITNFWDKNTILTVDPNANHYSPDHPWHSIAEEYVNKPFLQYIDLIKNAKELHLTDSSFYCLTCFLDTKATVKVCYDRDTSLVSKEYFFD
jgi:hypothetical protein